MPGPALLIRANMVFMGLWYGLRRKEVATVNVRLRAADRAAIDSDYFRCSHSEHP